jgi:thiol-disulfide isomerase/thioredoxin
MIISKEKKFIYLAVPKTGTTSVQKYLLENDKTATKNSVEINGKYHKFGEHMTALKIKSLLGVNYQNFIIIGFVRHPYGRIVSSYFFYKKGGKEAWRGKQEQRSLGDKLRIKSTEILPFKIWALVYPYKSNKEYFIDESEYKIPLKLEYKSGRKGLLITSLLKYDIEYSFADTALRVVLNVGTYYPNFTIETPKVGTDELVKKNFLLKEPFFFMERYWVLQNLDIKNHTIELIRFPKGIKPKGYKQGYYVDVDSLFADHGIPEEVQNRTDSSLFLLYFWGTWCHPCVKNMPKTNKLGQLAKGTDRLSMFGVALMSRGQVEQDIREFEKEYTLTFPSFVESFEAPHHFIRKLLNMRYPSYYLLNNKGRIIYKGENTPELWRALEKHGNIRKE